MPTESAMITKVITAKPDEPVAEAYHRLKKNKIHSLPVIDEEGIYLGIFTSHVIAKKILPVSATMEGGLDDITFIHDSAQIDQKFNELMQQKVNDVMRTHVKPLHKDTPMLEGLKRLYTDKIALPVVSEKTGKLEGLLCAWEIFDHLDKNKKI